MKKMTSIVYSLVSFIQQDITAHSSTKQKSKFNNSVICGLSNVVLCLQGHFMYMYIVEVSVCCVTSVDSYMYLNYFDL